MLKNRLNRIINAGVYPDLPDLEKRRIRLLNRLLILGMMMLLVFGIIDLINGYIEMVVVALLLSLITIFEQYLVKHRKYELAKSITFALFCLAGAGTCIVVGDQANGQYILMPMVMVPLVIYSSKRLAIFLALCVVAVFITVYFLQQIVEPIVVLPDSLVPIYTLSAAIMIMMIIFLFTLYFRNANEEFEGTIISQKEQLNEAYTSMTDSINYAKRIQFSLLPTDTLLKENLPEHFVIFQPKDIVSGDFYWATKKGDDFFLAICDSTGHGVPGAFMSLMNSNFLNEAINEKNLSEPGEILDHVRKRLVENLYRDGGKDGMDGTLIKFAGNKLKLSYSSANNKPVLLRNGELKELPADKMPVGYSDKTLNFTTHYFDLNQGDLLYFFTDGLADQFGGTNDKRSSGKKLKTANLKKLLNSISHQGMEDQKKSIQNFFSEWKGDLEQVDDVCLVGIKF